ncbi:RdgB/HAM1 family non-canonical purine NTP pyrophosphatase [Sinimarinibacterium thermocellulolyticum]|uniref:dITP/XTP pyrophosphatase n=1 Tax=Sinimarinibacterium thermocellulolyticum TaxID=3170016 RepID=A0ABV2AD82_9GAMM
MNTREVVLASRNAKKLAEMQALLAPLGLRVRLVSEFCDQTPEESAPTFVENALLKARHAARASGLMAIADDSGLEVAALRGAPGVHSARYGGVHGDDAANNRKLLQALDGRPESERAARFVCALACLRHADDPVPMIALGLWHGRVLEAPRGTNGFGYDPLFWVPDQNRSAAELDPAVKNRISHRARAFASLLAQLREM